MMTDQEIAHYSPTHPVVEGKEGQLVIGKKVVGMDRWITYLLRSSERARDLREALRQMDDNAARALCADLIRCLHNQYTAFGRVRLDKEFAPFKQRFGTG
jgi:hypothetical protein